MQNYPAYRTRRRRFPVVPVILLALVILVGLFAILLLPSYLTKRSLDQFAAQLPAGTSFAYDGVHYGLFSDTLELHHAVYQLPVDFFGPEAGSEPLTVTIGKVTIKGGNTHLGDAQAAGEKADAAPVLTTLAQQVVLADVTTSYGGSTAGVKEVTIDKPQFDFATFYAPLSPLQPDTGPLGLALDSVQGGLQKISRIVVSFAYDRLAEKELTISVKEPGAIGKINVTLTDLVSQGMARGGSQAINFAGLGVQAGLFSLRLDSGETGAVPNTAFWQAIHAGVSLDEAMKNFQGAPQALHGLHALNGPNEIGSLATFTIGNLAYAGGVPTSLTASLDQLQLNLAAIPLPTAALLRHLGYQTMQFNGGITYHFDPATRLSTLSDTSLTLADGGKLALSATLEQPEVPTTLPALAAKIVGMSMRYDDAGLYGKLLAYEAAASHQPADIVSQGWVAMLEEQRQRLLAEQSWSAAIDQLERFIADPKSLTMTLTPPTPVSVSDLDEAHPESFASQLGLVLQAD